MPTTNRIEVKQSYVEASNNSNSNDLKKNVDQIVVASSVNKIRLTISSPYVARTITSRLRRGLYTPRDLLASSEISLRVHHSRHDDDEEERVVAAEEIVSIQIENDGLCQFGCGGRYSGKSIMVTQITPILLPESLVGDPFCLLTNFFLLFCSDFAVLIFPTLLTDIQRPN